MKIGIVTFHWAINYGAVLQAFGLYRKLIEIFPKDEVYIVNYRPDNINKNPSIGLFRHITFIFRLPFVKIRFFLFDKFLKRSFKFVDVENISCLDYLVCGSDQIWNAEITNGIDPYYFGNIKNFSGRIITYAASDGGYFEKNNHDNIENYIKNISQLSVRESGMLQALKKYRQDITVVIDPVFLIDNEYWKYLATIKKYKKYILVYRVTKDDIALRDACELGKRKNLRVVEIINWAPSNMFKYKRNIVSCASIPDFLSYFINAEFIFTDSFHGTAFSIIFNKYFFVYKLNKRNERIHNILSKFDLLNRYNEYFKLENINDIDYQTINSLIQSEKKIGVSFLMDAMCNNI